MKPLKFLPIALLILVPGTTGCAGKCEIVQHEAGSADTTTVERSGNDCSITTYSIAGAKDSVGPSPR